MYDTAERIQRVSRPGGCFISQPVNSHAGRTSWLKKEVPLTKQNRLNTCCLRAASLASGAMKLYSLFYIQYCLKNILLKAWLIFASNRAIACFICCLFKKFRQDRLSEWLHPGYSLTRKNVCYFWVAHPWKIQGLIPLSETHLYLLW